MRHRPYDPARDLAFPTWREAHGWARVKARHTLRRFVARRARPEDAIGGRLAAAHAHGHPVWITQPTSDAVWLP